MLNCRLGGLDAGDDWFEGPDPPMAKTLTITTTATPARMPAIVRIESSWTHPMRGLFGGGAMGFRYPALDNDAATTVNARTVVYWTACWPSELCTEDHVTEQ